MGAMARVLVSVLLGLLILLAVSSCEEDDVVGPDRNRAPDTFITRAPRERSESAVWVRIYWRGWDEDGVILSYEYAVDDTSFTAWRTTTRTDSTFLFRVEEDDRDVEHTFYVAAVDDDGKRDPTPAFRTFTAVDRFAPLVDSLWGTFLRAGEPAAFFANGDTVPAVALGEEPYEVRFSWTGSDEDGEVVRYFWRIGEDPPEEVAYDSVVTVSAGAVYPKDPADRTQYVLSVQAEDDAGLRGGGGTAGVEPARLAFAVDFTPVSEIDSIRVDGTRLGVGWDPGAEDTIWTLPVDTLFTEEDIDLVGPGNPLLFPREARLTVYWHSSDQEEGCVESARWQAQGGAMLDRSTESAWREPTGCLGGESYGFVPTDELASGPLANPLKLWVRARDSHERMEEPGPSVSFLVNYLPTVEIDEIVVDPGTGDVTIFWHGTDRDNIEQDIRYEVSLDSGGRQEIGAARQITYPDDELDPGVSDHVFRIRVSNNFDTGQFVEADTTFTIN